MTLLIALLLALVVAWFLARPHFVAEGTNLQNYSDTTSLIDQRSRCVQVLKDLELDFLTGKIADKDYNEMRNGLSSELAEIIKKLNA